MKILTFNTATYPTLSNRILKTLSAGGVIVYPTETCYGIGVDATNEKAVSTLLSYKGNRGNKPISIAVHNKAMANTYVEINPLANHLYSTLLPGPVTVISKSKGKVAASLISDMGTLGVRIPDYPLLLQLIEDYGKPITSTSANTSGAKPPYAVEEFKRYTSNNKLTMIDLFLNAGTLPVRPPSTVVDTTLNEPTILRQGEIHLPSTAAVFGSFSVEKTIHIGEEIMRSLVNYLDDSAVIIGMQGELGAGKTHLTKGIGKALGIIETINSPTYTIVKEYTYHSAGGMLSGVISGELYHIDTWRLHDGAELWDLGFETMIKPGNVIVVEWLQKVKPILTALKMRAHVVWLDIKTVNEQEREIKVWHEA